MTGSLQGRLIRRLTAVIGLVALVSGVLSFYNAYADAQELQDEFLGQVAATMRPASVNERLPGADGSVDPGSESRLIVQSIDSGTLLAPGALALAPDLVDGLQTVDLPNGRFRVVVRTLPGGHRFAVAQPTEMRDDIALDSAFNTVLPLAVLAPMLALLTMLLVKATLAPVQRIAHEVDGRSENDLNPLPTDGLPLELAPFVGAINRLLARVATTLASQRRFVADAAHELRSPLAALSLQAEHLGDATLPDPARARLDTLSSGIGRARHLLEQLLSLARSQGSAAPANPPAASVPKVYRQVLETLLPLAGQRGIDLGLGEVADVQVALSEFDLFTVVKNVVDNAIRYADEGGRVDLRAVAEGKLVRLSVDDDGPGIPEAEKLRVFDAFYRVLGSDASGSGLGLAIVRSIVERAGGQVELGAPPPPAHGLVVSISLPAAPAAPAGTP